MSPFERNCSTWLIFSDRLPRKQENIFYLNNFRRQCVTILRKKAPSEFFSQAICLHLRRWRLFRLILIMSICQLWKMGNYLTVRFLVTRINLSFYSHVDQTSFVVSPYFFQTCCKLVANTLFALLQSSCYDSCVYFELYCETHYTEMPGPNRWEEFLLRKLWNAEFDKKTILSGTENCLVKSLFVLNPSTCQHVLTLILTFTMEKSIVLHNQKNEQVSTRSTNVYWLLCFVNALTESANCTNCIGDQKWDLDLSQILKQSKNDNSSKNWKRVSTFLCF